VWVQYVSYLKHFATKTTTTTTTNYMISMEFMNSYPSVNVFRPPVFFVKEIKVIIPKNRPQNMKVRLC